MASLPGSACCLNSISTTANSFRTASTAVGRFFKDLTDERFTTPFAIYHRRFSTNTVPKWPLAQPMRFLGHNGAFGWAAGCSRRTAGCRREFGMAMKCTAADEKNN